MPLTGHCLCKAVTYSVDIEQPLMTGYDHCDDCQRQTGSSYSLIALVPKEKLRIYGDIKRWAGTGGSGNVVYRVFCPQCGSPIAHEPNSNPAISFLKAGTLDMEIKETLRPVRITRKILEASQG
ncbi:unnamed protein product [Penicillium pancosmium]